MIISFRSSTESKPVLEIDDTQKDQVVIRFISRDEHITLHLQDDGTLLRTHYYPNKPTSTWDEAKINTARVLGYGNPERHGNYAIHTPLVKISNVSGYHLVGRSIDLLSLNPRQRYFTNIDKTINTPQDKFILTMYLSTKENPCDSKLEHIPTSLGSICFSIGS